MQSTVPGTMSEITMQSTGANNEAINECLQWTPCNELNCSKATLLFPGAIHRLPASTSRYGHINNFQYNLPISFIVDEKQQRDHAHSIYTKSRLINEKKTTPIWFDLSSISSQFRGGSRRTRFPWLAAFPTLTITRGTIPITTWASLAVVSLSLIRKSGGS